MPVPIGLIAYEIQPSNLTREATKAIKMEALEEL